MENYNFDSATIKKDMEEHKRREEVALARILVLERELDQKQKLEFEIVQLKDKLKVIEHYLQGKEDIYKLMDKSQKKREEESEGLEELHDFQLMKHKVNQNDARAQLIEGPAKMLKGPTLIGTKRMGDLHIKPFESACKKFPAESVDMRALEPCCSKDVEICNPSWHPSKLIECDGQIVDYRSEDLLQHTIGRVSSTSQMAKEKANNLIFAQFLQTDIVANESTTSLQRVPEMTTSNSNSSSDELILWPWVGILVNLPMEEVHDVSLKEQFSEFNPINVIASLERNSVSRKGEGLILFNRNAKGFKDAMAFENQFKLKRMGKKEWYEKKGLNLIGIHGWIAHDDDYNSDRMFAKILGKHGEMKTVADEIEVVKDNGRMMVSLVKKMDVMDKYLQELKCRYSETTLSIENIMNSNSKVQQEYNEGE